MNTPSLRLEESNANLTPNFYIDRDIPAIKAEKTLAELAEQFDVHPHQITTGRTQLLEGAADVFGDEAKPAPAAAVDLKSLHAKIGELTLENDFLAGALGTAVLLPSAKR